MKNYLRILTLGVLLVLAFPVMAKSWFVQAGASEDGNGKRAAPFATLAEVEAISGDGDNIFVLPSIAALDGGITLKKRAEVTRF